MKNTRLNLLWLDDYRNPLKDNWLVFSPIGRNVNTIWCKSYQEFCDYILDKGLPDGICFDHDLGTEPNIIEKNGYDAAKWLIEYCQDNDLNLPMYSSQSANPVGRKNIITLLNNYARRKNYP